MSSGESIIEIFKFYIGCLQKIFSVLDSFEFLPGISFLDFMIALVIISLLVKLLHFGITDTEVFKDDKLVGFNRNLKFSVGNKYSKTISSHRTIKDKSVSSYKQLNRTGDFSNKGIKK